MPVDLYQPFTNPITGETFKCISYSPESYVMEWALAPKGYVPFEHIHYYQDEIFYVESGRLKLKVEGKEHILNPGEQFTVPMGAAHVAENNGDETLKCIVSYNPGSDYYTFSQCFIGLQYDGEYNKKGQINVPKMAYFIHATKCKALARPTTIPKLAFKFVVPFFGVIGSVAGWNKQLARYID